jgi:hypothetical protein
MAGLTPRAHCPTQQCKLCIKPVFELSREQYFVSDTIPHLRLESKSLFTFLGSALVVVQFSKGSEPNARLLRRSETRRFARLAQIPRGAKEACSG